ncbi:MAG TPA: cytochrome c [Usitatibacter sp.]
MKSPRIRALILAFAGLAALAAAAPEKDVFEFVPEGGRTLLAKAFAGRVPAEDVRAIIGGKHTSVEWVADLRAREKSLPALKRLDDKERRTLADYLAANMPLAKPPADPAKASWDKALPLDGRDMALNYCQGCHIITVVITQDRSKTAWLGTMGKPSHVQIKLTPAQRDALANYLIVNAAIPIDQVPEELRAGGATY